VELFTGESLIYRHLSHLPVYKNGQKVKQKHIILRGTPVELFTGESLIYGQLSHLPTSKNGQKETERFRFWIVQIMNLINKI